jgi:hypothetical protein
MKVWFYCKVPLHICLKGGSVHVLCSHMSALRFRTNPSFDCPNDNLSDGAFVWASKSIGGWDAVEEFISCDVWPLAAGVNFEQVKVPLPRFPISHEDDEDDIKFLARVEQEARVVVGSYTCTEHKACLTGLQNNSHLNHVLELVRVAYGPRPVPISTKVLKKSSAKAFEDA